MFTQLAKQINNSSEERRSASKKVKAIQTLIDEIKRDVEYEVSLIQSEQNLSFKQFNDLVEEKQAKRFNTIFSLIQGQDPKLVNDLLDYQCKEYEKKYGHKPDQEKIYDMWVDIFDGSGIEGWWE